MNKAIVLAIETMANQKSLSKELLFNAMEDALTLVASKSLQLGEQHGLKASINRQTGELELRIIWEVVSDETTIENSNQMHYSKAKADYSDINVGDEIEEIIHNPELSRIAYHQARQILTRIVREADRNRIAESYIKRINTIFTGKVKRVTREHVLVEIEEGIDGILSRKDMMERDIFRVGDRARALLVEVNPERSAMLKLSRINPEFIIELFKQEVPECSDGVVQIKAAARDPGSRAKIAVKSNDTRIDPIGSCIGMRGSRIQTVTNELNGERIDIIMWDDDIAQLTINAMAPASIHSISINESTHSMDIAVKTDQLANAIGKNGQNIKLASQLVGWKLNVMTQEQAENRFKTRNLLLLKLFKEALDVDDDVANILIREGYGSLDEVISATISELSRIKEFDENIAQALTDRAKQAMVRQAITGENCEASNLHEIDGISAEIAQKLLENNINTKDDLAELDVDELCELIQISKDTAAEMILAARQDWFEDMRDNT